MRSTAPLCTQFASTAILMTFQDLVDSLNIALLQPLYNAAVAFARQREMARAMDFLLQAQKVKVTELEKRIDKALSNINVDINVSVRWAPDMYV